jgi:hypothetical protein
VGKGILREPNRKKMWIGADKWKGQQTVTFLVVAVEKSS